jgi:hypothetical protein
MKTSSGSRYKNIGKLLKVLRNKGSGFFFILPIRTRDTVTYGSLKVFKCPMAGRVKYFSFHQFPKSLYQVRGIHGKSVKNKERVNADALDGEGRGLSPAGDSRHCVAR